MSRELLEDLRQLRGWRVGVLGAILLAFALRTAHLGGQSLWYDEAFSLLLARHDLQEILGRTALDTMPPLYYWLLHLWGTGPPVEFYPRFLSVLCGTLSVALVGSVARLLFDQRIAVAASFFAAVSPFQVFYGQEVRMYALLGLWDLAAAYGFLLGWRRNSKAGWALYGGGAALALYTHALGWMPPVALAAWAVAAARGSPGRLRGPLLALGGAFLVSTPWLLVLAGQAQRVLASFWVGPPSLLSPLASLYLFFEGPFAGPVLYPVALGVLLLTLALALHPLFRRRNQELASLALVWTWLALPLLMLFALSQVRSVYLERVIIGASFPEYLLLAWAAVRLAPRWVGATLGVLVLAVGLWGLRNWYGEPSFGKPPQRDAARVVQELWQPQEPVVHTSDGSLLPFLLYTPGLPHHLLLGDPEYYAHTARARSTYDALGIQPRAAEEAIGAQRFLLVVALDHSLEYQTEVAAQFDETYQRLGEEKIGGILVRRYQLR